MGENREKNRELTSIQNPTKITAEFVSMDLWVFNSVRFSE